MQCSTEETVENHNGSFRTSTCINRAEILLVDDPCCGLCYTCAYEKLKAELEKLNKYIEKRQSTSEYDEGRANADAALQAENKRLKVGIKHIKEWCGLNMEGMTVEGIVGAVMRMCDDIKTKP